MRGAQTAQPAPSALASCPNLADPGVCRSPSSRCRPRRRHARPGPVERWRGRKNDLWTQVTVGVPHRSQFRNWLGTGEVGHQETSVSDCSQSFKPALRQESDLTREQRNLIDAEIGSRPVDKWRRDFANVRSRGGTAFGPRCRRLPLQNPLRHNRIPVAESDDPAGRRQVGLAEAAGGPREQFVVAAPGLTAEPGAAFAEVDQQAGGVNDGTKEQAAAVQLRPAPSVAPEQVLPSAGQVNGCATGYGARSRLPAADAAKSCRSRGADRRRPFPVLDLH